MKERKEDQRKIDSKEQNKGFKKETKGQRRQFYTKIQINGPSKQNSLEA